MKNFFFLIFLFGSVSLFAQSPQKISYQAIVRDAASNLVINAPVGIRISILQASPTGPAPYVETHNETTNVNGLLTLEIGGGTVVSGTFSTINWGFGPFFLKTEIDPTGGSNYSIIGTQQLLSVPYALSASALTLTSPNGTVWGLSIDNQGVISTQNLNCIPVGNVGFSIPASVNAGTSFIPTGLNPTGTPPYTYFWEVVPPDPNVTFSNPNIIDPEISFAQTIPPGTSKNIKVTVGNCFGASSLSFNQSTTVLAPPCPQGLQIDTTLNIISGCNYLNYGASVDANTNSIYFTLANSTMVSFCGNFYLGFSALVNCSNNSFTIPLSTPSVSGWCSGTITIQGSGTFNASMTLINLSYTLTINGTPYNCTATIQP